MESWEYAVGHSGLSGKWDNDTDPTSFELASRDLIAQTILFGGEDWAYNLRVVRRSYRHPAWIPVQDHAAELLAETLGNIAKDLNRTSPRVPPTQAMAYVLATAAKALVPKNTPEEYDS